MTNQEFEKLLKKGSAMNIVSGSFQMAVGIFLFIALISVSSNEDSYFVKEFGLIGQIVLGASALLFGYIGYNNWRKVLSTSYLLKKGKHKLRNAVVENDEEYVLWMYPQVEKRGKSGIMDYFVWVFGNDKKSYCIEGKDDKHLLSILQFLKMKFPQALIGDSKENKKAYKAKLKN